MAAFNRNNNLIQNRPPYENNNNRKQVACRLCECVLNGTQALISHIESHIAHDEISSINRQNQHHHLFQQQNIPMRNNIQPNNQFFFPNPNLPPRFAPSSAPSSAPIQIKTPRPYLFVPNGGVVAPMRPVVQRPIPLWGPNLSLTLGGGVAASGTHSVKINRSQPLISPYLAKKDRSWGRPVKRARWSVPEEEEEGEDVGPNDGTRPFLSQLDYPIPRIVDLEMEYEDGLDLTLKL